MRCASSSANATAWRSAAMKGSHAALRSYKSGIMHCKLGGVPKPHCYTTGLRCHCNCTRPPSRVYTAE